VPVCEKRSAPRARGRAKGGLLLAPLTGQGQAEIFPRSETEFFLKIVQAEIIFARDPDGRVTSLTLKQAGITLTGKRVE